MNKYLKLSIVFTVLYIPLIIIRVHPFLNQYFEIFNFGNFRFGIVSYVTFVFIILATITGVMAIIQATKSTSKWALVAWIFGIANILCLLLATMVLYNTITTFGP